ncbi:MFS transporter [Cytobacillus sp. Hm23]
MESAISSRNERQKLEFKKNYPIFRYLGGNLISFFGDQIYLVALPLIVLAITGSPLSMGIFAALERLPNILIPLTGPLADRLNRKAVLLVCDFCRGLIVAGIGILFTLEHLEMWHLYASAVVLGILTQLYSTTQFASIPTLVQKKDLHTINSLQSIIFNTGVLVGPTLGGLIISLFHPGYALILNSFSFFLAFCAVATITIPYEKPLKAEDKILTSFFSDLKVGFEFVFKTKILNYTNIVLMISTFGTTLFLTVLIFHLKSTVQLGEIKIGILLSIGGIGAIVGSLLTNIIKKYVSYLKIVFFSLLMGGLSIILFGAATSYLLLIIANAIGTMSVALINPCIRTIRQTNTPGHLLGRVQATSRFITWTLLPASALLAGWLSILVGTSSVIIIGGVICSLSAFILLCLIKFSHH